MGKHAPPADHNDYDDYHNQAAAPRRGLVIVASTRAAQGVYEDESGKTLATWLASRGFDTPEPVIVADADIPNHFAQLFGDIASLPQVVLTTGGTGPAPRDVTPEATLNVVEKEMPGFGEQMRQISLYYVPTAILSRQTAGIRGKCLIVNLPGRPKAIAETLGGVRGEEGGIKVHGLFSAIPYCIDLIGGPFIETDETVSKAFRPQRK